MGRARRSHQPEPHDSQQVAGQPGHLRVAGLVRDRLAVDQ
jgi:hypothetical protein